MIQIVLAFSMTWALESRPLYLIWVCASWSCEGGQIAIIPALAGQVYGSTLGVKINALLFAGFSVASLIGVMLNNLVVPELGWGSIYIIQGAMSLVSLIMLFCFTIEKTTFIPFDDERPLFYERKLSQMPKGRSRKKRERRTLERRNTIGTSSYS